MGGKDSPPPCVSTSPVQSPKWGRTRQLSQSFRMPKKSSPAFEFEYRSHSGSSASLQPSSTARLQPGSSQSLPRDCSGSYSPVRAYMECLAPQTLKFAIVGDSGVGKTSLLMSYTVDKFPETHAPTIYDKYSSKFSNYSETMHGLRRHTYSCTNAHDIYFLKTRENFVSNC